MTTWFKEVTQLKRSWCWERWKRVGEGDARGWDGWMTSLTQWTWVWESSGSWWWTGKPGVLQSMGLQRLGHDWVPELNWTIALRQYRFQYFTYFKYITYFILVWITLFIALSHTSVCYTIIPIFRSKVQYLQFEVDACSCVINVTDNIMAIRVCLNTNSYLWQI